MARRMYRTQILLEPEQHQTLAAIARREGRSVSDLLREMVRDQLDQRKEAADAALERQLAALERIRRHRNMIIAQRGGHPLELDVVELIDQMRAERDARHLGGLDRDGN